MEYIIISAVAFLASGLTLFSGFGLGTLLLPVFALFFPIELAIALTAIVHLLNNVFKFSLLARYAVLEIILKFGLPAAAAAYLGAEILVLLSGTEPITSYMLFNKIFRIELVKVVIAVLILIFALLELFPESEKFSFNKKYIFLGGFLSGFFGGLSGHQGALRSAFLIKMDLTKESFIATGIVISFFIDVSRLFVYSTDFFGEQVSSNLYLLLSVTLSAFLGAFLGRVLLKKITFKFVRNIVGIMLIFISIGLGLGII